MCMGILNLTVAEEVGKSSGLIYFFGVPGRIAAHSLTLSTMYE